MQENKSESYLKKKLNNIYGYVARKHKKKSCAIRLKRHYKQNLRHRSSKEDEEMRVRHNIIQ